MDPDLPCLADYYKFADTLPQPSLIVDSAGEVVFANAFARDAFLYKSNKFFARSINQLIPEKLRARHDEHLRSFMESPSPSSQMTVSDVPALRADGTTFRISVRLQRIKFCEGLHIVALCHDESDHFEKESELRAELNNQVKKAHEDPLTSLSNSSNCER